MTYARRRETLEPFVRQGAIPATTHDELGQSIWLGYIRRHLLRSGQLATLIKQGLRGVTSNPEIFEKAIAGSTDYEAPAVEPRRAREPEG